MKFIKIFFILIITIGNLGESLMCQETGMWYKGKFWSDYSYEGITSEEVEQKVKDFTAIINKSKVVLANKNRDIVMCQFTERDDKVGFLTVLDNNEYILSFIEDEEQLDDHKKSMVLTELWQGNIYEKTIERSIKARGMLELEVQPLDIFTFKGTLKSNPKDTLAIEMVISEDLMGAGNSTIEVKDNIAFLNGELGTNTYNQIKNLITNHPDVKTIIFQDVPGSTNDDINMHTGRLIRNGGFTTIVEANSEIHSGGVDLFCSGIERIISKTAVLGVHCWDDGEELTALDYPPLHPTHRFQIAYFNEMLGDNNGERFYFFTLNSAKAEEIHQMSVKEMETFKIGTKFK